MVSKVPITHIIDSVLKQLRASENLPEKRELIYRDYFGPKQWLEGRLSGQKLVLKNTQQILKRRKRRT